MSTPHPPPVTQPRILVIRGGAIGDFILTLPAIALLRDAFPTAHVEILGIRHILALAEKRFYADEIRSIEYAPLAGFFNPKSDLDPELCAYFSGFNQVISYLFDPDNFFKGNLERAGVQNLLVADPRIGDHAHAALQLAAPLQRLALFLEESAAQFFPSDADLATARDLIPCGQHPLIALHPGSGGERKNWPTDRWTDLIPRLTADHPTAQFLVVGGEADAAPLAAFRTRHAATPNVHFLTNLPLSTLGAIFSQCDAYLGHDSGISHLAAAAGCPCVLLFGPTDPMVWSPQNEFVRVIHAASGKLADIPLDSVLSSANALLRDA